MPINAEYAMPVELTKSKDLLAVVVPTIGGLYI